MIKIDEWINHILEKDLPEEIVAINFNLYEDGDSKWSIEIVGTNSFDIENSDWACDEIFNAKDELKSWVQETNWEDIQQQVVNEVKKYIDDGKYSEKIKSFPVIRNYRSMIEKFDTKCYTKVKCEVEEK